MSVLLANNSWVECIYVVLVGLFGFSCKLIPVFGFARRKFEKEILSNNKGSKIEKEQRD